MPSQIIHTASGRQFYAELSWQLLEKGVDRDLIVAAREKSAKHAIRIETKHTADGAGGTKKKSQKKRIAAGIYVPALDAEDKPPLKEAHALAAVFATWTQDYDLAILVAEFNASASPDKVVLKTSVVVIDRGLPVMDKIYDDINQAALAVNGFLQTNTAEPALYTNRSDVIPYGLKVDRLLDNVALAATKHTQIRSLPFDIVGVGLPITVAVALFVGWYAYKKMDANRKAQVKQAEAQANDPTPKYVNALVAAKRTAGYDAASLQLAFDKILQLPTRIPQDGAGWSLKTVSCEFSKGCTSAWNRKLGSYTQLAAALPEHKLQTNNDSINMNQAFLSSPIEIQSAVFPVELPSNDKFIYQSPGSQLQDWMTAGLTVQLQAAELWPSVPGVSNKLKLPQRVKAGAVEINGIALPQLAEVITKAPTNIVWTGMTLELSQSADVMSTARAKLKGKYYVKD